MATTPAPAAGGAPVETVFPPFDATHFSSQLVWLAITFGALYWLMSRVALPRVQGILETRAARIARDLDEAAAARTKAEEAGKAYEKTLADAKAKAQAMAQDTHNTLAAESDARRHALEDNLNTKLAAAEAEIEAIKTKSMGNVSAIASDAAAAIVARITGRPADADAIARAIAKA